MTEEGTEPSRSRNNKGGRFTIVVMATFLVLFAYEFGLRETVIGSGLPELPEWLTMLATVGTPFALFSFGVYAVIAGFSLVSRTRAGKQPKSRAQRMAGAWGTAVLLGVSAYAAWKMYVPVATDGYGPEWIGFLVFPLGIAALLVSMRAIGITVGAGEPVQASGDEGSGADTAVGELDTERAEPAHHQVNIASRDGTPTGP